MKLGNVLLIVIMSIFTFIGLALTKLYETYIKNNILVQGCLYLFFTLFMLRGLIWAARPLLKGLHLGQILHGLNIHVNITAPDVTPLLILGVFVVVIIAACIFIKKIIEGAKC